jgi:hypothetical protein
VRGWSRGKNRTFGSIAFACGWIGRSRDRINEARWSGNRFESHLHSLTMNVSLTVGNRETM